MRRHISDAADRYLASYENQSPTIWRIKDDLLGPAGKESRREHVESILMCMFGTCSLPPTANMNSKQLQWLKELREAYASKRTAKPAGAIISRPPRGHNFPKAAPWGAPALHFFGELEGRTRRSLRVRGTAMGGHMRVPALGLARQRRDNDPRPPK